MSVKVKAANVLYSLKNRKVGDGTVESVMLTKEQFEEPLFKRLGFLASEYGVKAVGAAVARLSKRAVSGFGVALPMDQELGTWHSDGGTLKPVSIETCEYHMSILGSGIYDHNRCRARYFRKLPTNSLVDVETNYGDLPQNLLGHFRLNLIKGLNFIDKEMGGRVMKIYGTQTD